MLILLAMALPLIIAGHFVIRLWAGPDYAQHSTLILQVLILANVIRLCALPYSTLLLGTGQQSKVVISPIAEGVTNLTVSVVGAYLMGAIGVAIGTLIGSFVSLGLHLLYNMPRTSLIPIDRPRFVKEGLLRPLACAAPFGFVLALRFVADLRDQSQILLISIAALGAVLLFWNYGLIGSEREKLAHALRLL
jgi:O-antigen/teichoic acid export membrane protein